MRNADPQPINVTEVICRQCGDESPTCMLASITNGKGGDPLSTDQVGKVECTSRWFRPAATQSTTRGGTASATQGQSFSEPSSRTSDADAAKGTKGSQIASTGSTTWASEIESVVSRGASSSAAPSDPTTTSGATGSDVESSTREELTRSNTSTASDEPAASDTPSVGDTSESDKPVRSDAAATSGSRASDDLLQSSATRIVPPLALTLFTVTHTITTLVTSTITA